MKTNTKAKILKLVLMLGILAALTIVLPAAVSAETSGTCGDNLTWMLDDTGTLTISGTGDMKNWKYNSTPWYSLKDDIITVIIENGVSSIGDYAFYKCTKLKTVNIEDSIITIGKYVFYECNKLMNIIIPDSVKSIGESTFSHCTKLNSVYLSNSLVSIDNDMFYNCFNLASINIPKSVISIGESAFENCQSLLNITIPDSVINIEEKAFSYCKELKNITIPDSVISIGARAFIACEKLTSIHLPDHILNIEDGTFANCYKLSNIILPNRLISIGAYAFSYCYSLTSIEIPDGVTTIDSYAFNNCTKLVYVIIPENIINIDHSCFDWCLELQKVYYKGSVKDWRELELDYGTLPDGNSWGQDGAVLVTDWHIDSKSRFVYSIKSNASIAIVGYLDLAATSCTIPNKICGYTVSVIDIKAFAELKSLQSVTIPDSVTAIKDYAFYGCISLTNITIPDGVTSINRSSFDSCTSLTSITIPKSVTYIGGSAFNNCSKLSTVHYNGTETEWNNISIYSYNTCLTDAERIYFAYINLLDKNGNELISTTQNIGETVNTSNINIPNRYTLKLYKDANLTEEFSLKTPISENLTLYTIIKAPVTLQAQIVNGIFLLTPTNAENGDCIIFACYKGGKMVYVNSYIYAGETIIPFTPTENYDKVKIMVWEGLETLSSLCEAEEF